MGVDGEAHGLGLQAVSTRGAQQESPGGPCPPLSAGVERPVLGTAPLLLPAFLDSFFPEA